MTVSGRMSGGLDQVEQVVQPSHLHGEGIPLPQGKVKLISGDDFVFIVDEDAARVSTTIRGMLDSEGEFQETKSRTVHLREISSRALEKCCQYFYYRLRYSNVPSKSIPQFDVPPELALELLMASNYLDM